MNWWKGEPNCSKEEKEKHNKIWENIRDFFFNLPTSLIILLFKANGKKETPT